MIGFTNNKENELKIDIFINPEYHYGYFFKIGEKPYAFRKNGNSIIRQQITKEDTSSPDFTLLQYK